MQQIKIITHNGLFHSDEVFAVAFLKYIYEHETVNIIRTRDTELIAKAQQETKTYVLDVGGLHEKEKRNFDHHQEDYKGKHSSFGLLINALSDTQVIRLFKFSEVFASFYKQLVLPIDTWDNNVENVIQLAYSNHIYSLQRIIGAFNQSIPFGQKQDKAFMDAVCFAKNIIIQEIDAAKESHYETLMCEKYLLDGSINIKNKKAISEVFFSTFKSWVKQKGLNYIMLPIPNENLSYNYLIYSKNSQKYMLPIDSKSHFRHKAGFIIIFKKYQDALNYFEKL